MLNDANVLMDYHLCSINTIANYLSITFQFIDYVIIILVSYVCVCRRRRSGKADTNRKWRYYAMCTRLAVAEWDFWFSVLCIFYCFVVILFVHSSIFGFLDKGSIALLSEQPQIPYDNATENWLNGKKWISNEFYWPLPINVFVVVVGIVWT